MTAAGPSPAQASGHSRRLAICVFDDEKTTTPRKAAPAFWSYVVKMHTLRTLRDGKSGPMIGGYAINGTRCDDNVPFHSIVQLDIDTEVRKEKTTGRILEVLRPAPPLSDIRPGIDEYEWLAVSTHSHEPQLGVIKYRIVILPDRDILPEEWVPLLEALDDLLHGALDRGAWPWSQSFYLPSCPAKNASDAFFVQNEGQPLPVDKFVKRGRDIVAAPGRKKSFSQLGSKRQPLSPMPETPENIELVKSMLSAIDPDVARPEWRQICWAVLATGWNCAPQLIREWSTGGQKFTETDFADVVRDFDVDGGTGFGTLVHIAKQHGWAGAVPGVTIDDFYAYMPMHNYIFKWTGELWPGTSVNARCPPISVGNEKKISASQWLDQNKAVEQTTWAPGERQLIADRLVSNGGWIEHSGANCFNLYRPPVLQSGGDPTKAGPWVKHIYKVYPNDIVPMLYWLAHRVQCPREKINHALVLGGEQGIGKDTILEPVKRAIGPWNFEEASPKQLLGRFNGFLKSVILRVSEARDLGEIDRFQFYDHMKTYTASPPDVLRIDEKHLREHYVFNCCGVIITTNHKTDGLYLPHDDRRHYVAWSDCTKDDFGDKYFQDLWDWYWNGGFAHVASFLTQLDISKFDPKAPPFKTSAFLDIADATRAPEDAELADAIDALGNPDALTLNQIKVASLSNPEFHAWISDRKNNRAIPYRLEKCGYTSVRNGNTADGQWKIGGSRVRIYAKKTLPLNERLSAAAALALK